MKLALRLAPIGLLALAGTALLGAGPSAMPGVTRPDRAHVDYMLKCQGCHQAGGQGNAVNTPPLAGEVARFLAVPGGREFLGQVPGVASIDLDDQRLAELLNWTLFRFDAGHVPADFKPYTPDELARLRRTPLRLDRLAVRNRLIAQMEKTTTQ